MIKDIEMYMLRDYQIEICERVREAFKKHRSVMMQMPTGTGKTVVLAELVRRPPCPSVGGSCCAEVVHCLLWSFWEL